MARKPPCGYPLFERAVTLDYRVRALPAALLSAAVLSVLVAAPASRAAANDGRLYVSQVDQATQLQLQTMQNSIRNLQVQLQQLTQIKEALTQAQQHDKEQAALIEQRFGKIDSALSGSRLLELVSQVETLNTDLNKMRGELELLRNQFDKAEKRDKSLNSDFSDRLNKLEHASKESSDDSATVAKSTDTATADDATSVSEGASPGAATTSQPSAALAGETAADAALSAAAATAPSSPSSTASTPTTNASSAVGATTASAASAPAPSVTAAAASTTPAAVASNTKPAARDPIAENKLYDEALRQFRGGNYQGAVASFESFTDKYPSSALAPNARYWIGVSHFNQRDFAKALQSNQALMKVYPDSAKVPDAMLNIASIHVEQNDYTAARNMLEEVIAKYPASDAAGKARTRLTLLKK